MADEVFKFNVTAPISDGDAWFNVCCEGGPLGEQNISYIAISKHVPEAKRLAGWLRDLLNAADFTKLA